MSFKIVNNQNIATGIPATIVVNDVTGDDTVSIEESGATINVTGSAGGSAEQGDAVSLVVNGTTYSGTLDASNDFSIAVSGDDLLLDTTIDATVSGLDINGTAFTTTQVFSHLSFANPTAIGGTGSDLLNNGQPYLNSLREGYEFAVILTSAASGANLDNFIVHTITTEADSYVFNLSVINPALTPGDYNFQARDVEKDGDKSPWSAPFTFRIT